MTAAHRRTAHRINYARAGTVVMAGLTALATMFLLNPSAGQAAQTHYVIYDALGGNKGNMNVAVGDVVVFENALPLAPLTGAVVPVNMTLGAETFPVGATPVSRTITASTSYTGTYAVLGLVPLTSTSGTITAAAVPPPPPPAPPPPSGGGNPPPAGGNPSPPPGGGGGGNPPPTYPGGGGGNNPPPTYPGGGGGSGNPPSTYPGGTLPGGGSADPGGAAALSDNANGSHRISGSTSHTPDGAPGLVAGHKSDSKATFEPGSSKSRSGALANAGPVPFGLGLIALLGAILLLGVGIALARTLRSGRLDAPATA